MRDRPASGFHRTYGKDPKFIAGPFQLPAAPEDATAPILLPPIIEQHEIIQHIETAFAWLNRVAAEHGNASRLLPKLDQAILAKAFRGELVPQDT
jgi:hypothetical protein